MSKQRRAWFRGYAIVATAFGIALGAVPAHAADRAAQMQAHRGGTMRLVARAAEGTLDPQINYTLKYWQLYQSLYDGLVAFKKAAGTAAFTLVPDLAEAIPPPADDGRTYTFKLRNGIKFADGSDVTVKDVVASFQRIFKVSSPTSGSFYNGIIGADACLKSAADCTLKGGVVGDEKAGTVTFHLTEPDAEFMDKLAVPHASILPASTPAKDVGTDPVPGTGAYMIKSYDPNRRMTLVRNPHFKEWSVDAQPDGFVDQIDYDFGLTDEAEVTAVENGQADWMYDYPPTDRLAEMATRFTKQVHLTPLTAMWYAPMNVNLPPFDKLEVRQAVNYAIDRKAMVNLFGGPNLGHAVLPDPAAGLSRLRALLPVHQEPGQEVDRPRSRQGEGAHRAGRGQGAEGDGHRPGHRRRPGGRHLPAERAQRDRPRRRFEGALAQHSVHLHPEHQQPRADQRLAMVPGLSGSLGLPERAVQLRLIPSGLGFVHQHLGFLRQEDRRRDAGGDDQGRDRPRCRQQDVGEDRQGGDRRGAGRRAVQPQARRLRLQAAGQLHLQLAVLLAGRQHPG